MQRNSKQPIQAKFKLAIGVQSIIYASSTRFVQDSGPTNSIYYDTGLVGTVWAKRNVLEGFSTVSRSKLAIESVPTLH